MESVRRSLLRLTQSIIVERVGVDSVTSVPPSPFRSPGGDGATFLCGCAIPATKNTMAARSLRRGRRDIQVNRLKGHPHPVYHRENLQKK